MVTLWFWDKTLWFESDFTIDFPPKFWGWFYPKPVADMASLPCDIITLHVIHSPHSHKVPPPPPSWHWHDLPTLCTHHHLFIAHSLVYSLAMVTREYLPSLPSWRWEHSSSVSSGASTFVFCSFCSGASVPRTFKTQCCFPLGNIF